MIIVLCLLPHRRTRLQVWCLVLLLVLALVVRRSPLVPVPVRPFLPLAAVRVLVGQAVPPVSERSSPGSRGARNDAKTGESPVPPAAPAQCPLFQFCTRLRALIVPSPVAKFQPEAVP